MVETLSLKNAFPFRIAQKIKLQPLSKWLRHSLKNAFPFRIAQKIKKEVRNFASDPHPPFKVVA